MPPKARKSGTNNWYTCEACGVVLSQKDVQIHNSSACPPCETDWDYAFIKDRVLFSHLELSDIDGDPCVKGNKKQFFVFMSQSAMQLCQFKIGEQIVLSLNETDSIVRTVFPTYDRSLTSVTIAPVISGINQTLLKESCRVKVHKVPDKPLPAAFIRLTTFSEIAVDRVDQLVTVTKQFYSGKLLRRGLELNVPFFGKSVDMVVKDITPLKCATDGSLEDQFEHLNINKASSTEPYFLVIEKSNWLISLKGKNKEKEVKSKFTSLSDVGGYKELIQELVRSISVVLKRTSSSSHFSSSLGILLYGPNGVGKTFLSEALANEFEVPVVKISSGELFSKFYGETELRLRNLFTEAKDKSPSIIILDNIDTLCPRRGGTEQERRVISYLLTLLDSLKGYKVVVLATTSQINLIDTALRRPGRLDCEVELPIPSRDDRFEILKVLLAKWTVEESEVMQLASVAHGYVAADLQSLVTRAVMRAVSCDKTCDGSDLHWALALTKPSAMREVMIQVPNVKWTDIGGMDDLKLKLQQAIEWPLRHPEAFTRLGISPPRGVLMYGPPGCSKTMIAKALATESKLNFLSIKGSELFSKWVGESEKAVQSLFKKARAVAPSIVFLDELDALGGERSGQSEGSNVQERVLAQLLTEMDGVEPLGNVNIVGATNRPDRIDKALLRPGRLDRMVYVPLPDLETRICILQLQLVKMPVAGDIVIDDLALKTEGYSGAEVVAVCHEAAMSALQEDFNVSEVCERHFVSALEMVKPRTPWSLLELYDTYTKL